MSKRKEIRRETKDKTESGPGQKKDGEMHLKAGKYLMDGNGEELTGGDDRKGLELLAPEVTTAAKNPSLRA